MDEHLQTDQAPAACRTHSRSGASASKLTHWLIRSLDILYCHSKLAAHVTSGSCLRQAAALHTLAARRSAGSTIAAHIIAALPIAGCTTADASIAVAYTSALHPWQMAMMDAADTMTGASQLTVKESIHLSESGTAWIFLPYSISTCSATRSDILDYCSELHGMVPPQAKVTADNGQASRQVL